MTTITIERELLEQALNALSAPNHCVFSEPPICVDIRAALAAPATAPDEHDDAMRAYVDADRAQQPPDASWRFAIDQARIVNCLDCTTSADDPVKSLAELIQWEVQTALDPSVSPAAQALIDQGLAMREQAAQPATAPERKPKPFIGTRSAIYKCTDCGHEQSVQEIHTEYGVYVGSGANWCDKCGDGKPERKETP